MNDVFDVLDLRNTVGFAERIALDPQYGEILAICGNGAVAIDECGNFIETWFFSTEVRIEKPDDGVIGVQRTASGWHYLFRQDDLIYNRILHIGGYKEVCMEALPVDVNSVCWDSRGRRLVLSAGVDKLLLVDAVTGHVQWDTVITDESGESIQMLEQTKVRGWNKKDTWFLTEAIGPVGGIGAIWHADTGRRKYVYLI